MEPRILSLAALTVLELSPPDMVEAVARVGYSHVGLHLVPATMEEHHYPLLADAGLRRRTLARLRDNGVRTLNVEILRLRPDTHAGEFVTVLEAGVEFGVYYVLVAGNDGDGRRSTDNFAALYDLARLFGLDPHLEFTPWTGIRDLRQAVWVVEVVAWDNADLLLDAFHFDRSASGLEDPRAIPPARLGYAQFCDIVGPRPTSMDEILRQAYEERCSPGDGGFGLLALLHALPENLPLSLEVPVLGLLARGVDGAERARLAVEWTRALLAHLQHHRAGRLSVCIMERGFIVSKR